MKSKNIATFIFLLISTMCFSQQADKYKIAVTIDDLPLQKIDYYKQEELEKVFNKLVSEVKLQKVYAIGFVIENKLNTNGSTDKAKEKLIENWLNAGIDLGNHTYSHLSANKVTVAEYEEEIVKGEKTVKKLLQEKGKELKYFRHPFLNTGLSLEVRDEINSFLANRGYTIAPVTLDNSEWIFASAYEKAYNSNDNEMMKKIGDEYLSYMKKKIEYYEGRSIVLFGRNISHVLLIHANRLNSEYYGALIGMIKNMNYEFVSLDEALKDEAYKTKENFVKNAGISWIDRWALAMGKKRDFFAGDIRCPEYIMKYANIESE